MSVFDYANITHHRNKIAANTHHWFLDFLAKKIFENVEIFFPEKNITNILQLNCHSGQLTKLIYNFSEQIYCIDFSSQMLQINQKIHPKIQTFHIKDEILPDFTQNFQLIVDFFGLFFINNLPLLLAQIKKLLNKSGFFIGTFFGSQTLYELKKVMFTLDIQFFDGVYQRIAPFFLIEDLISLLQKLNFKNINIENEIFTFDCDTLLQIIHDLRFLGNLLEANNSQMNKEYWQEICRIYPKNSHKKLPLSVEIFTVIAQ